MIKKVNNLSQHLLFEKNYKWENLYNGKKLNHIPFHNYSDLYFRIENKKIISWGSAKIFKINKIRKSYYEKRKKNHETK